MIKLNLGCGQYYKPGYINIDIEEKEIADKVQDVSNLEYDSNSVDIIEASHILEHFDIIRLPYILSEWFRVLKPGGILCIETPNLLKSILIPKKRNIESMKLTYQFLFGIDYKGNQHKMGFVPKMLKKYLKETGYDEISRQKQTSFKSEYGLRIRCKKPMEIKDYEAKIFVNNFRMKMKQTFDLSDTILIEHIERNCIDLFNQTKLPYDLRKLKEEQFLDIVAALALFHPTIAKIFVGLYQSFQPFEVKLEFLNYLESIKLASKMLEIWKNWLKNKEIGLYNLLAFYNYWTIKVKTCFTMEDGYNNMFSYVETLPNSDYNHFCFDLVSIISTKYANLGIKYFSKNNVIEAEKNLLESLKLQPLDPIINWNLARINANRDEDQKAQSYFQNAVRNVRAGKKRKKMKSELKLLKQGNKKEIPFEPVQIRF